MKSLNKNQVLFYISLYMLCFIKPAVLCAEFDLLKDENPVERSREAGRLGNEMLADAVPDLIDTLRDKVTGVRINAIVALGKISDERAIEPLIDILNNDPVNAARVIAAEALGNFKSKKVKDELLKACDNDNENIRCSAVKSVGKIGGEKEIDKLLEKAQNDDRWSVRESAVKALTGLVKKSRADRKKVQKLLKNIVRDKNERVRKAAQEAINRIEVNE